MTPENLGKIIKVRRKTLGVTQQDFCEIGTISCHTLSDIESGKGNPSINTLVNILDILGLELIIRVQEDE